jgi:UDP-N-acetylglucosamine 2-epimerase
MYSPKIIILPEDTGIGTRPLARLAKTRGLKIITLQHGTMEDITLYSESISDIMAVWGEDSQEALVKCGVPRNKLIITGMARLDTFSEFSSTARQNVTKSLNLDPKKRVFVWTPSVFERLRSHGSSLINEELIMSLNRIPSAFNDIELVVKVHPLDNSTIYERANSMHVVKDFDTFELLNSCDALLVTNSTSGVEAIALGKPVIFLNFHHVPETIPYTKYGAAIRVTNLHELLNAIKSLQNEEVRKTLEEGRKKFIYRYLYKLDRRASVRIANVIASMLEGN